MLRLFLADASESRRAKIRRDLAQVELPVQVVGEASDGGLALPKIRDLQPDVLIADADMPFMNGIQLCRAVSMTFPWMQILITGGSDDPVYDERVRSIGATRLHPPFDAFELNEVLRVVRRRREKMLLQALNVLQSAEEHRSPARLERERQFQDYLLTDHPDPRLNIPGRPCRLLLFHSHGEKTLRIVRACFASAEKNQIPGQTLMLQLPEGIGVILAGRSEMRLENTAYIMAHTVQAAVNRLLNRDNLAVRIGEQVCDGESLRQSYRKLRELPGDVHELRPIYGVGDAMRRDPEHPVALNILTERLCAASKEELPAILDECRNAELMTPKEIAEGCAMLAAEVKAPGEWTPQEDYTSQLAQLQRAVELRDACRPEFRHFSLSRARSTVAKNICNAMLMLYDVAEQAGVSPGRLCVLFQQELGWSFTHYLGYMRVYRAMRLLRRTRTRISTIARSVGYHDHAYFENVFHIINATSAAEYRKRGRIHP